MIYVLFFIVYYAIGAVLVVLDELFFKQDSSFIEASWNPNGHKTLGDLVDKVATSDTMMVIIPFWPVLFALFLLICPTYLIAKAVRKKLGTINL